jgi:hypothetical protein
MPAGRKWEDRGALGRDAVGAGKQRGYEQEHHVLRTMQKEQGGAK